MDCAFGQSLWMDDKVDSALDTEIESARNEQNFGQKLLILTFHCSI